MLVEHIGQNSLLGMAAHAYTPSISVVEAGWSGTQSYIFSYKVSSKLDETLSQKQTNKNKKMNQNS